MHSKRYRRTLTKLISPSTCLSADPARRLARIVGATVVKLTREDVTKVVIQWSKSEHLLSMP